MFVLLGLLLGLLALAFVLYPIVRPRPDPREASGASDLEERRRALYHQILDVEFDQQLGKLGENDARELSEDLLRQADRLFADEPSAERQIEAELEHEMAAGRHALAASRQPARDAPTS
jgi:uncharacterized membrane protein YccC